MSKIDFLSHFEEKREDFSFRFFSIFLACLSPEECCDLFKEIFSKSNVWTMTAFAKKVKNDIERNIGHQEYKELFTYVSRRIRTQDYRGKQKSLSFLLKTYDCFDSTRKRNFLQKCLNSSSKSFRKYAYEIIDNNWKVSHQEKLLENILRYGDEKAQSILLYRANPEFLEIHFEEIFGVVQKGFLLGKLFLRIANNVTNEMMERLFVKNPMTYLYVAVKTGHVVSEERAKEVYERIDKIHDIGFFAWCLGQLKFWDLLFSLYNTKNL